VVQLWDSCGGESGASYELGPGVLRPDGTVFYAGANSCGAGNTAVYDTQTAPGTRAPPSRPTTTSRTARRARAERQGADDGEPRFGLPPSTFFEWDGQHLTPVQGTPNAPSDLVVLRQHAGAADGQILLTDFSNDIEIYTPATGPRPERR